MSVRRKPLWYRSGGAPRAEVAGASVVTKWRRPPHQYGGGLGGGKAEEAPVCMWQGPRWYQRVGVPHLQGWPKGSQSGGGGGGARQCGGGRGGLKLLDTLGETQWKSNAMQPPPHVAASE